MVEKVGFAERAQQRWRGGKKEMDLKLDVNQLKLLNQMVREPTQLPLTPLGLIPYQGKDAVAVSQLIKITKWLETRVFKDPLPDGRYAGWNSEVKLSKSLIERLLDMMEYYEPVGRMTDRCIPYLSLKAMLEGKEWDESEYEDFEDDDEEEAPNELQAEKDNAKIVPPPEKISEDKELVAAKGD